MSAERVDKKWQEKGLESYSTEAILGTLQHYGVTTDEAAFKKVAENMVDSFVKGDLVIVTGRVSTEDWEDKDGNKRTSVNLVVDSIGPSIAFTPAHTQRSETGSRRTEAAIQQSRQTVPADDEPPF